jgi:hypothetical protein
VAVPALPEIEPEMVFEKVLVPLKVLLFARSVDEAAVMVMSCEPLKAVPLMFLEVWRRVAVPAFPVIEPVMVLATVRAPKLAAAAKRLVLEAVVEKRFVVVAAVVVERVIELKICAPVHVGEKV